jgi:hypothetical protein
VSCRPNSLSSATDRKNPLIAAEISGSNCGHSMI